MLLKYLNENFPGPFSDDFLKSSFKDFGVDVSIEDNKFLFKYDMISADWNNPLTEYCRGSIFRYSFGEGWEYVARPWKKFFNRHEGRSGYSTEEDFKKLSGNSVELFQKLDRSCCEVWYDVDKSSWRVSTLGSISTASVGDFPFTFAELFWKTFGNDSSRFEIGSTYLFELCTVYNRIVTEYEHNHVVFLGAYSNASGDFLEALSQKVGTGLLKPIKIPFEFTSWKALEDFVEAESKKTRYGKNPEGFVGYVNGYPKFKCKNNNYLNLHGLFTGDKMFVKKNIVNLFFQGGLDDVEKDLPTESKEFLQILRSRYEGVLDQIFVAENFLKPFAKDRKTYALKVQEIIPKYTYLKHFYGYYFEKLDTGLQFSEWLLKDNKGQFNYEKQMPFWKSSEQLVAV
jgi:hypothetical protein